MLFHRIRHYGISNVITAEIRRPSVGSNPGILLQRNPGIQSKILCINYVVTETLVVIEVEIENFNFNTAITKYTEPNL